MAPTQHLSVVVPVHNERENLAALLEELAGVLADVPHEVIVVDDGSTDGSDLELQRLALAQHDFRLVRLGRRAGQSAALAAGFEIAAGGIVATLDADGQNDPADLPAMLAPVMNGSADAVVGFRARRASGRWKAAQSAVANTVRNWITGDRVRDTGCGIRVMRAEVLEAVPRFNGMHRFFPTLLRAAGGRVVETAVTERARRHGRSKYGMWNRVFVGFHDAFGVRWLRRRSLRYRVEEAGNG